MIARADKGQFAKGNAGGPGRPPRATEGSYLLALSEAVTLEDWRDVVARGVADAKAGDARARDWLSRYLLGDTLTLTAAAEQDAESVEQRARVSAIIEKLIRTAKAARTR